MSDLDFKPDSLSITAMTEHDWTAVCAIYAEGIATGNATFETTLPDWDRWNGAHLLAFRLVARSTDGVLDWAALSPVSSRRVYAGVAEVSIYVAGPARGRKVGSKLLHALTAAAEQQGIWTLQASIFPENAASVELHRRHGFRVVGTREKIACLQGRWRDVLLMERRSSVVGN